jgi:hypothetical protein
MAADQRYCLSCGNRRGEPRVTPPPAATAPLAAPERPTVQQAAPPPRQADVSPLAAVIGIALLGGMLLIGVLIGRGVNDDPPETVVRVADATSGSSVVASEWPEGTEGYTIQLTTVPKDGATAESVEAAKQQAVDDGAIDAAVLDSDLYPSLPPGNYVIYSGVFTDRSSADVALKGLSKDAPGAAVVEVAASGGDDTAAVPEAEVPTTPEADTGSASPDAGAEPEIPSPSGAIEGD